MAALALLLPRRKYHLAAVRHAWTSLRNLGSDRPYHYLGSAIWFTRIRRAMGEAMLEMM